MKSKWVSLLAPLTFGLLCAAGCGGSAVRDGNPSGSAGSGGSGGTDLGACSTNSDCELQSTSCCDCGTGPLSDYIAINRKYEGQSSPRCAGIACDGCPPIAPEPSYPWNYYVATCAAGHCRVVDLGATDVTQCRTANDCSLRGGTACCASCGTDPVIAIAASKESELEQLVCDGAPVACGPCATPTGNWVPDCSNRRCTVSLAQCTVQHPCPL